MRKSGAKHSRTAVLPLNLRSNRQEMRARGALVALSADCLNEQHLCDLYILADLCHNINQRRAAHITTHADSVKRMCNEIKDRDYRTSTTLMLAMIASSNLLIDWMATQPNKKIYDAAQAAMQRILRQ